jgi:hypothetical protein
VKAGPDAEGSLLIGHREPTQQGDDLLAPASSCHTVHQIDPWGLGFIQAHRPEQQFNGLVDLAILDQKIDQPITRLTRDLSVTEARQPFQSLIDMAVTEERLR